MRLSALTTLIGFIVISNLYDLRSQTESFDLFVSSRNTNSVKRFDGQTAEFLGDFVQPGAAGLSATQEVAFGPDGHLYVSGRGNKYILKYDGQTGTFLGNFTSGYELNGPTKMTFGPDGMLYVSQWGQQLSKVARFDAVTGDFVDEFTDIDINQACGHAWDDTGNLYVASFGSRHVLKFHATQGKFLGIFTEVGNLSGPVNLWFGGDGDLFVADWTLGAVLRFDGQTGSFESPFITGMQNSEGVTVGPDGLFYICDWSRNEINRYDDSGNFVDVFAMDGGMLRPNSLAFGPPSVPTSVAHTKVPEKFALSQNFPNPFNPTTRIRLTRPKSSFVTLKLYNALGQEITTLVNEILPAGDHQTEWNADDFPSGVYFYDVRAGEFRETRKLMLLK